MPLCSWDTEVRYGGLIDRGEVAAVELGLQNGFPEKAVDHVIYTEPFKLSREVSELRF